MRLQFLCGTHRMELTRNPAMAISCWQNGFDTGQLLCDQNMWQEAVPHLGCAFETSEIVLTTKAVAPECAYEIFTSAAALLIDALAELGYPDRCRDIYWMAVKRLTRELSCHPEARTCVARHLEHLYRHPQLAAAARQQAEDGAPYLPKPPRTVVH